MPVPIHAGSGSYRFQVRPVPGLHPFTAIPKTADGFRFTVRFTGSLYTGWLKANRVQLSIYRITDLLD